MARDILVGIGPQGAIKGGKRVEKALEGIRRKSKRVHSAGAKDAKKHAKGLNLISKAAALLVVTLAAKSLVKSTINFGQAISDLSAITGATGKDLDFLRQKSKEFGETTTLSATQAAEAFRVIASAKPDLLENAQALAVVTEEAIALAEATGEDLPAAANVLGASLNQFGAGADEASRFINVLAAGSKRGAALVGEMGEALKFAGIIAAQSGLSFEQTNASLQLMSTFAIKGGEAGTQLRGVLLALSSQSKDEWNPEIVGLTGALDNLAAANLTSGQTTKLFGRRNKAAASILVEHRDKLAKLTEQLTDTDVAYDQQAIRIDNLSGDIKALKSAYEGLELTIGAKLNGALRLSTQRMTENIRAISKHPLTSKATVAVLDTVHRIFEDIGLTFDQITTAVDKNVVSWIAFESVAEQAIGNVVTAAKFLWRNFAIGGPANLKLGFTLMIAAADRFRIFLVEGMRIVTFQVVKFFVAMGGEVEEVFDNIKTFIGKSIDSIIGAVQQQIFKVARAVAAVGFEERAREITDMGIAVGKLANFEEAATKKAEENAIARKAQLDLIDELITETIETAEVQRAASRAAVEGAVAERDATLKAIEALRTKRKIIRDGKQDDEDSGLDTGGILTDLEGIEDAYVNLNDTQKMVVDSMSDGIAEMTIQGKADFRSLANSIIADLIRMAARAALNPIFASLFSLGGGGGPLPIPIGGGDIDFGSLLAGSTGAAATGAKFKVGGVGGQDSQLVAFKASPDEVVTVTRPDQRALQPTGRGKGTVIHLTVPIQIDASNADDGTVGRLREVALEIQEGVVSVIHERLVNGTLGLV